VEKEIDDISHEMKRGIILVASISGDFWLMEKVQVPVPNAFHLLNHPHLEELDQLLSLYGATGIVMIGSEQVQVLDTLLGEIRNEWYIEWDVEQEDWREFKGLADSNRMASSANHKEQYKKRFEANQQRWLRDLCTKFTNAGEQLEWKRIILTGEEDLTLEVSKELKTDHEHIIKKNMNGRPNHQILQSIYQEIEDLENKQAG
jgi:hypothetical protein